MTIRTFASWLDSICDATGLTLLRQQKGETTHKVRGLRLGADDYMVKPFEPEELVARVNALLRRYRINTDQMVEVGELRLDYTSHDVSFQGQTLILPPKEFELLFKLASYPGRTLSREQLIEDIWGYDFDGDERTVDVHIKRLRDKFPEEKGLFRIRTVRGLGYRFETPKRNYFGRQRPAEPDLDQPADQWNQVYRTGRFALHLA